MYVHSEKLKKLTVMIIDMIFVLFLDWNPLLYVNI